MSLDSLECWESNQQCREGGGPGFLQPMEELPSSILTAGNLTQVGAKGAFPTTVAAGDRAVRVTFSGW